MRVLTNINTVQIIETVTIKELECNSWLQVASSVRIRPTSRAIHPEWQFDMTEAVLTNCCLSSSHLPPNPTLNCVCGDMKFLIRPCYLASITSHREEGEPIWDKANTTTNTTSIPFGWLAQFTPMQVLLVGGKSP